MSAELLIPTATFYEHVSEVAAWLPRLGDDPTRGYYYDVRHVLQPARKAVVESVSVLRRLEELVRVPLSQRVTSLPFSDVEDVISMQEALDQGNDEP